MEREIIGVYQFTHPGSEHKVKYKMSGTDLYFKEWNYRFKRTSKGFKTNNHHRKYMRAKTSYLHNGDLYKGMADFWGEWEPNSIASLLNEKPNEFFPKYVHYPVYIENSEYAPCNDGLTQSIIDVKREDYLNENVPEIHSFIHPNEKPPLDSLNNSNLQNTDPFIFGDNFYYTCCKQHETQHLKEGSVILFGTCYRSKKVFEIDTVFVISKIIPYDKDVLKETLYHFKTSRNKSERLYYDVVLKQVFRRHDSSIAYFNDKKYQFDIIIGATYNNPYNGMYSYFFCNPSNSTGMPKLRIEDNSDIFNMLDDQSDHGFGLTLSTHGKNIIVNNKTKTYNMWDTIKRYAEYKGYCLGVEVEIPPILSPYEIKDYLKEIY